MLYFFNKLISLFFKGISPIYDAFNKIAFRCKKVWNLFIISVKIIELLKIK